jgi:hypothetical protein
VGSVWRGTACKNSDIDIQTFSQDPIQVLNQLKTQNFNVKTSEWRSVTKKGRKDSSLHIHILLPSRDEAEVIVRSHDQLEQPERCEIYGDAKTGLNLNELTKVLKEYPLQKFVPI